MNLIVRPTRKIKNLIEFSTTFQFLDKKNLGKTQTGNDRNVTDPEGVETNDENAGKFASLLNVSLINANRVLEKHPELSQLSFNAIKKRAKYLVEKNVRNETVQKIPWILLFKSQIVEIRSKEICQCLQLSEMSTALPFFKMHMRKIIETGRKWKFEKFETKSRYNHRLYFLSENLECHPDSVAHMMSRATNLMMIPEERIHRMIQLVKEAEINKTRVISDPYFLVQNVDLAEGRVRAAQHEGVSQIKPWYLRTGAVHFDRLVDREGRKEQILKGKTIKDFFLKSLDCKEAEFLRLRLRVPSLRTLSVFKMNQMVEFLISQGFTKAEIRRTPAIFAFSVETLERKLMDLRELAQTPTLNNLVKSSKVHEAVIRNLKCKSNFSVAN